MFSFFSHILKYFFFLFGYIKSDRLFPKPLSKTEEEYYLKRYFEGEKHAKDKLINHNLRLVAHIAKKYVSNNYDLEDLISIGTIGLIKGINSFCNKKGFKVSTYASRCIENEILMHIRSSKKVKAEISLNTVIGSDKDGNDMHLSDTVPVKSVDPNEDIYNKMLKKDVIEYIDTKLTEREKSIMHMRYGLDNGEYMTQEEVAKVLNLSRSYISRIETKIRKDFKKNGLVF